MKLGIAIVVAGVLGTVVFCFVFPRDFVEPIEARRELKAKSEIQSIELLFLTTENITNVLHALNNSTRTCSVSSSEVFSAIAARSTGANMVFPDDRWSELHRFTDPWGGDYEFLFERTTARGLSLGWAVRVRSAGRNKRDDAGRGDDITSRTIELTR